MAGKYAFAAKIALQEIGKPARIPKILEVMKLNGFRDGGKTPDKTLRNEIRKNSVNVQHIEPGQKLNLFFAHGGGYYGLELWQRKHVASLPEEITKDSVGYKEGAVQRITINKYERDPGARDACLDYYGTTCQACKVPMHQVYGLAGKDLIHVHHKKPLSQIKKEYIPDPIQDLVPVCPNCHAIIHREDPPMKIEKLQKIINENKK